MSRIHGRVASGFEVVAEAFARQFVDRPQMGAALAIYRGGRPVVDLWGGVSDARDGRPWVEHTPTVVFSCTKGIISLIAARLVQDGALNPDAPVAKYWPEFGSHGKDRLPARQLLAHRAGLAVPSPRMTREVLLDADRAAAALAGQAPAWEPGSGWAYHAITHGWLVGELVRRITGFDLADRLRAWLTEPLGADFWIGRPAMVAGHVARIALAPSAHRYFEEAPDGPGRDALTLGGLLAADLVGTGPDGFNDPDLQEAQIPGVGGIGTARAVAKMWSSTVTETAGYRSLEDGTLDRVLAVQTEGPPVAEPMPPFPRWGMGFQLPSGGTAYLGDGSFGHDGHGGQVAFADREHRLGFAFLTNWLEVDAERGRELVAALRRALA